MKIFRYLLPIQDYQQVQLIWPGRVLSVGSHDYDENTGWEIPLESPDRGIDLWATAAEEHEVRGKVGEYGQPPSAPVLGIWIVGTGNPLPPEIAEHDALFHGTVDKRPALGAWHVFSAVVGVAAEKPPPLGEVSSYADIVDKIKARHGARNPQGVPKT